MTVADLLRILRAIPDEHRELPVLCDDGQDVREVTVVSIDPEGALYYDRSGVLLQSRVYRPASGQRLYTIVPTPLRGGDPGTPD